MRTARHLKLLAAVSIVLLALSGFSPARSSGGHGGGGKSRTSGHSGSGGGGCSSKKSSSHSDYDSNDDYGSSSSGSSSGSGSTSGYTSSGSTSGSRSSSGGSTNGSSNGSARGQVAECVTTARPSAVVNVKNTAKSARTLTVRMDFNDETGVSLDSGSATARVPASGTKRVKVPMGDPGLADRVTDCVVVSVS